MRTVKNIFPRTHREDLKKKNTKKRGFYKNISLRNKKREFFITYFFNDNLFMEQPTFFKKKYFFSNFIVFVEFLKNIFPINEECRRICYLKDQQGIINYDLPKKIFFSKTYKRGFDKEIFLQGPRNVTFLKKIVF